MGNSIQSEVINQSKEFKDEKVFINGFVTRCRSLNKKDKKNDGISF